MEINIEMTKIDILDYSQEDLQNELDEESKLDEERKLHGSPLSDEEKSKKIKQ